MKKMLRFFSLVAIIAIVLSSSLMFQLEAQAAGQITEVEIDLSSNVASATDISVSFLFKVETALQATDKIKLTFRDAWTSGQWDVSAIDDEAEITIRYADNKADAIAGSGTFQAITLEPDSVIPTHDAVFGTTEADWDILWLETATAIPATKFVYLLIENAGGADGIGSPSVDGTYVIDVDSYEADGTTENDLGAGAVVIGTNNVIISGTVDPTLTLALSATECELGTLTSDTIKSCQYSTTVTTNADSGYTAYIRETGNLSKDSGTTNITDAAGTTVSKGVRSYGLATDDTDGGLDITSQITSANCTASTTDETRAGQAITAADQSYSYADGPVGGTAGQTYLCHSASIDGTTEAGVYTHTVIITVVGNF